MAIKINTDAVNLCATRIHQYNIEINNSFSKAEHYVSRLSSSWQSGVSSQVCNEFYRIKKSFYDNRYTVIDDMRRFMTDSVSYNYANTEARLSDFASQFK